MSKFYIKPDGIACRQVIFMSSTIDPTYSPGWYFINETEQIEAGPFATGEVAYEELLKYSEKLQPSKLFEFIPVSVHLIDEVNQEDILIKLGKIAGVAYQSDKAMYEQRLAKCMKDGHESVLEHQSISVEIVCDRATTHALVRHRHCAYTQESTIYCNYNRFNKVQFILPQEYADDFFHTVSFMYLNDSRPAGVKRDILPNCTKTTLIMTTNIREWRYILGLRSDPKDSGRMHTVIQLLKEQFKNVLPFFFADIPQIWR